jgi:hypothetical protein
MWTASSTIIDFCGSRERMMVAKARSIAASEAL